jgi:adenine/guanine phosphoribosyltransferase-like PRPP-binding protein
MQPHEFRPHDFWQEIHPAGSFSTAGPFNGFFPVALGDERQLRLPIRPLPDGQHALCSLIVNQASFAVVDALAQQLAEQIASLDPQVVVGLPTLGLTLAAALAQKLGHPRYVACGTSRKFWYDEGLSVPLSSITTPEQSKRLYLDPRMLPLLEGRRVVLVDDVISSGTSIVAGLSLLKAIDVQPIAIAAAMLQSERWHAALDTYGTEWRERVHGVFRTPLLTRSGEAGWLP